MQRLKKRSCCFLLVCLMIFTQIPFTANAAIYPDTANHWACSYIDFVTNKFIMTSPDGTYFYPSEPLTRIDAVKAAAKLVGVTVNSTNASDYLDIQGHPEYAGYVNWADDIGIIDEYSPYIFGPEFEIDRETFCTMLYRLYNAYDYPLLYKRSYVSFNDQSSISSWATEAINRLYRAEVINGGDTGNFEPQRDITRAEAAVALKNIFIDVRDATLTAVLDSSAPVALDNYMSSARSNLISRGYTPTKIGSMPSVTASQFDDYIIRSKIFVFHGHGSPTSLPMTSGANYTTSYLNALPSNGLGISDLIIFMGCETAGTNQQYSSTSLTGKAYAKGAAHVVGFTDEILSNQSDTWLRSFIASLCSGSTFSISGYIADQAVRTDYPNASQYISDANRKMLGSSTDRLEP